MSQVARSAIRSSWGRPSLPGARLVFLLGEPEDLGTQQQAGPGGGLDLTVSQLEEESRQHGDLVQGSFSDTYRNLTYKNLLGKLWVSTFCRQVGTGPGEEEMV